MEKAVMRYPLLAALACAAACTHPLEPTIDPQTGTSSVVFNSGGLSQRVELSKGTPKQGDTLSIKSVVTNVGVARTIESRICGLDLDGLELTTVRSEERRVGKESRG